MCEGIVDVVFWLEPVPPSSTRSAVVVPGVGRNSINMMRQCVAPAAVTSAAPLLVDRSFGSRLAYCGVMRAPAGGSELSGADDRIVMSALPPLAGRTKRTGNVAPPRQRIVP